MTNIPPRGFVRVTTEVCITRQWGFVQRSLPVAKIDLRQQVGHRKTSQINKNTQIHPQNKHPAQERWTQRECVGVVVKKQPIER